MKTELVIILGLLAVCAVTAGIFLAKNFSAIKAFTGSISTLTQQNSNEEQVIFDTNILVNFVNAAEKITNLKIIALILPPKQKSFLINLKRITPDIKTVLEKFGQNEQRWILIFQNSNEIRATGGFMGSYSIVEINQGKIISIDTEDIYDADGQFAGYFEAPPGVKEYLSGGKGLRLPDANWHPDTSKSAEQILPFFAFGNKQNINGVVFVNLEFAQKLLEFLGPIQLNDYNTVVTQDNLDEVLRSRRDDFFPGSAQKKHMLSQLLTQIKIKIFSLKPDNLIDLAYLVGNEIQNHNLQFYSNNHEIDNVFEKYQMRQLLSRPENSDYLYLIESNVGINKANKNISREVKISKSTNSRSVTINFSNNNAKPTLSKLTKLINLDLTQNAINSSEPANHLAYVNYQRVLIPPEWELKLARFQNNEIQNIDSSIIEINGLKLKQLGFLIILPEKNQAKLEMEFSVTDDFDRVFIQKQPGIPATNYNLEYNNQATYTLENNKLINYP